MDLVELYGQVEFITLDGLKMDKQMAMVDVFILMTHMMKVISKIMILLVQKMMNHLMNYLILLNVSLNLHM